MSRVPANLQILAEREAYREHYLRHRDPIAADRMLWRAHTLRHVFHLLPGQSILELGCGAGIFTRQLARVSRGENPITAVAFAGTEQSLKHPRVTFKPASALPDELQSADFDFVVAQDLLDRRNCAWTIQEVYRLLKPGGGVLFYESNPWNVMLRLRILAGRMLGRSDPRSLMSKSQLYELLSDVGFVKIFVTYNDFVYAPLSARLVWLLRNLSIVLENTPGIRNLAGAVLVHAQKPPRLAKRPTVSLAEHAQLRQAVSVVIPCRNEAANVEGLIDQLRSLFDDYLHEIIPVDDGSTDGTREVIQRLVARDPRIKPVFRRPPNGVGRALTDGYRAATGRYVLSMDCDFQHLLPEIRDLFDAAAEGHALVYGSRFSRHSVLLHYPFAKIVANRAFHVLAQLVLRRRLRDVTNNLKLMRRDILEQVQITEPGFAANAEVGLQPLLLGYDVREVPISWIDRDVGMGTSSFRVTQAGGGYWRVLGRTLLERSFGIGPYARLRPKPRAAGSEGHESLEGFRPHKAGGE